MSYSEPMRKLVLASLLCASASLVSAAEPPVHTKQVLSKVYTIDKIYRSMEGPGSIQRVTLGDDKSSELLWITGVKTEMVAEDGKSAQLPELMCHVNVDFDTVKHSELFGLSRVTAPRLITLSQGMLDSHMPAGFGFPVASNEPLTLYTQVLNLNIERPKNLKVRHRVTFTYVRDSDVTTAMKPLFNVGASGMVQLTDNPLALASMPTAATMPGVDNKASSSSSDMSGMDMGDHSNHLGNGTSCLVGARAPNAVGTSSDYVDPSGRHMTGHWIVPPGKQVNRSDITWFMALPFDTTLHYAAAHLHPFAKSLTIRDVTTGDVVFESKATGPSKGIGLSHVDTYSSQSGVPMYKDHKYELISVYDNPTKQNSDSMASAFLGLEDKEFVKPTAAMLESRTLESMDSPNVRYAVVRTNIGDFGIYLLREEAPQTVRQFTRLVRSGAYDHARIANVAAASALSLQLRPLTETQRASIHPVVPEQTVKHSPGMLSLCPGDPAFTIMLSKSDERDGRCNVFARIGPGAEVVHAMSLAPRNFDGSPQKEMEITRVDILMDSEDAANITLAPPKPIASLR
jgi:cyclophilin family peptidyl-prolyl cis-trans isomerase